MLMWCLVSDDRRLLRAQIVSQKCYHQHMKNIVQTVSTFGYASTAYKVSISPNCYYSQMTKIEMQLRKFSHNIQCKKNFKFIFKYICPSLGPSLWSHSTVPRNNVMMVLMFSDSMEKILNLQFCEIWINQNDGNFYELNLFLKSYNPNLRNHYSMGGKYDSQFCLKLTQIGWFADTKLKYEGLISIVHMISNISYENYF